MCLAQPQTAALKNFFEHAPNAAPIQQIHDPQLDTYKVQLYLKREDLLHPTLSGNKWRKLKYNLQHARQSGHTKLLTFGGAYSNHILATAAAGSIFGFDTVGIIRGEAYSPLNPVLQQAQAYGMDLHYISRAEYRHKMDSVALEKLRGAHGKFYLLPEGGTNALAVSGCSEIIHDIHLTGLDHDLITCPCGTGGTLAGLIHGLHTYYPNQAKQALGISVLNSGNNSSNNTSSGTMPTDDFLSQSVRQLLPSDNPINWQINHDYALGGYAKQISALTDFIQRFEKAHQIALDPIYTGKMMFALYDLIQKKHFAPGTKIIALLTGVNQTTQA